MKKPYLVFVLVLIWSLVATLPLHAQYFGRNKVAYDSFSFQVFKTDHFEIHYYPEEEQAVADAARMAERWYRRHAITFGRDFVERRPLIFYANDADFQQTNVIGGFIGEGVGGVTESLKQRVVMPLTGIYGETDHVLGHELVHSFQYDLAFSYVDTLRFNLNLIPLWLVEGMAEYLSVGREDAHTAMWLRDAALRNDLPTIDQLNSGKYFPYRYGQAYAAYLGGKYGDKTLANLFYWSGRVGLEAAIQTQYGITADSLSKEWQQAVKSAYLAAARGRTPVDSLGNVILSKSHSGTYNLAPVLSPDGRYVAFLSERDLFSINLFVADAQTGRILARVRNLASDVHFDEIRFISSAGTWSPDGRRLAFVTFARGDNEIAIWHVNTGKIERRVSVQGVTALSNPSWSPDGRSLAFSGLNGGISDLYLLDLETRAVRQLTQDRFADLEPTWSPDGRTLAFTTDRPSEVPGTDFGTLRYGTMRLAFLDLETGGIRVVAPLGQTDHHNPQFSADGKSLFFLASPDGFSDLWELVLEDHQVRRLTTVQTGISGITDLSPAMSVARQSGRMAFSVYHDNAFSVVVADPKAWAAGKEWFVAETVTEDAAILPPLSAKDKGVVAQYLDDPMTGLMPPQPMASDRYKAKLHLDHIAPPTLGVTLGGTYGNGLMGGVGLYFSDMLGNRELGIAVQASGTVKDIGAQMSYVNLKTRFHYGGSVAHIPYLYGVAYTDAVVDPETGAVRYRYNEILQRIYLDQVYASGAFALSTTRRIELSLGAVRYGFDYEVAHYYYNDGGRRVEKLPEPDPVYFVMPGVAFVSDRSFFGFTSPVMGGRQRLQVAPLVGSQNFVSVLADWRHYVFLRPFTVALRGLHRGNYGAAQEDTFAWEYLGYPYYPGFVRGYSFGSYGFEECSTPDCLEIDRLQGTRMALVSAELRIPLTGTQQFGVFEFPYLPIECAFFADAGVAWSAEESPDLVFSRDDTARIPVFSTGLTTRYNLFGVVVLEIYYAYPFQRPEKGGHLGWMLIPGW